MAVAGDGYVEFAFAVAVSDEIQACLQRQASELRLERQSLHLLHLDVVDDDFVRALHLSVNNPDVGFHLQFSAFYLASEHLYEEWREIGEVHVLELHLRLYVVLVGECAVIFHCCLSAVAEVGRDVDVVLSRCGEVVGLHLHVVYGVGEWHRLEAHVLVVYLNAAHAQFADGVFAGFAFRHVCHEVVVVVCRVSLDDVHLCVVDMYSVDVYVARDEFHEREVEAQVVHLHEGVCPVFLVDGDISERGVAGEDVEPEIPDVHLAPYQFFAVRVDVAFAHRCGEECHCHCHDGEQDDDHD